MSTTPEVPLMERIADLAPDKAFAHALEAGQFVMQQCRDCDRHVFFPRVICPHCSGVNLPWIVPSGTGTVYSTTVMNRRPDAGGPYNVALVRLDEGVQMMSRVVGLPPESVRIGMRVRASVERHNGAPTVLFRREQPS